MIDGARFEANWKGLQINSRFRTSNIVVKNCTFLGRPAAAVSAECTPHACDPSDVRCDLVAPWEVYWVKRSFAIGNQGAWVWILGNEFRDYASDTRAMMGIVEVYEGARGITFIEDNTFVNIHGRPRWEMNGQMRRAFPVLIWYRSGMVHVVRNTWRMLALDFMPCFASVEENADPQEVFVSENRIVNAMTGTDWVGARQQCEWTW